MKDALSIARITLDEERQWAARLMSTSEPWLTLGRSYEASLGMMADPLRESYLARLGGDPVAFLILQTRGVLVGYIQTVCVAPERRSLGLGSQLIAFAERRLFADFPNVFMCVSSFNRRAQELDERLGYVKVGILEDFIVPGHDELILRKRRRVRA